MANVMMPQKKPSSLGTVLQVGGGVAGGIMGGPSGAMAGVQAGGTAANLLSSSQSPVQPIQNSAVDRRIETMAQAPQVQLAQADAALAQLPPEYQQAYGPAIKKARQMDAEGGGYA